MTEILKIRNLTKSFILHPQAGARIRVFDRLSFDLNSAQSIAITGPSGMGKSSFLKMIFGSYVTDSGEILVRHHGVWFDVAKCTPRQMVTIRKKTIAYVSQFLRVIPRVATLDIVAEPLLEQGKTAAYQRAGELLSRLNIPQNLWQLSPLTFSGGEQQRVNIARGFAAPAPLMLLDEPTASLDDANRAIVLELINEARLQGSALLSVFHNSEDRAKACSDEFNLTDFREAA